MSPGLLLLCIAAVTVPLYALLHAVGLVRRARATAAWTAVEGRVRSAGRAPLPVPGAAPAKTAARGFVLEYEYDAGGRRHVAAEVVPPARVVRSARLLRPLGSLQPGDPVPVRVSPHDATRATVIVGVPTGQLVLYLLVAAATALAAWWIVARAAAVG